ncbi:MAG: hypothetical protein U1F42_06155 [Candidatus Competibacteraceae bacterium]
MSPSSTPAGNGYGEYGVRILGARGYPAGVVTALRGGAGVVDGPGGGRRQSTATGGATHPTTVISSVSMTP